MLVSGPRACDLGQAGWLGRGGASGPSVRGKRREGKWAELGENRPKPREREEREREGVLVGFVWGVLAQRGLGPFFFYFLSNF